MRKGLLDFTTEWGNHGRFNTLGVLTGDGRVLPLEGNWARVRFSYNSRFLRKFRHNINIHETEGHSLPLSYPSHPSFPDVILQRHNYALFQM